MPNYSLVINSQFRPLNYQEWSAPLKELSEAQLKQEEAFAQLEDDASVWEKLANNAQDAKQYKQYRNYADSLRQSADSLMRNGVSVDTRRNLMRARRGYKSEIEPIKEAYEKREKDREMQRELDIKTGGRTRYTQDAFNTGLDAYMNGNRPNWGSINLDTVAQGSASLAQAISKRIHSLRNEGKLANGQYFDFVQSTGWQNEDIENIINMFEDDPVVGNAIKEYKANIGINRFSDENTVNEINNAIKYGFRVGAVGEQQHQIQVNRDHMTPLESAQLEISRAQNRRAQEQHDIQMNALGYERDSKGRLVHTGGLSSIGGGVDINNNNRKDYGLEDHPEIVKIRPTVGEKGHYEAVDANGKVILRDDVIKRKIASANNRTNNQKSSIVKGVTAINSKGKMEDRETMKNCIPVAVGNLTANERDRLESAGIDTNSGRYIFGRDGTTIVAKSLDVVSGAGSQDNTSSGDDNEHYTTN